MKKYIVNLDILCFTINGNDYSLVKNQKVELPSDHDYVKTLVALKYVSEDVEKKPNKSQE